MSATTNANVVVDLPVTGDGNIFQSKTWFGHPIGLFVLFFTEMWERFSFYGMRALLVLYMTQYLIDAINGGLHVYGFGAVRGFFEALHGPLATQQLSTHIYGFYVGFVYFTPFFGGILADRWLGQRKAVWVGGAFFILGHFLMAFESMLFIALGLLCIGNGFFKPNISTQVGSLYPPGDARRDSAFTTFYMGINLGAVIAPLVCGTLGQKIGWHYGFTAAGVGMCIGMIIYFFGQKYLAPDRKELQAAGKEKKDEPLTKQDWMSILALTTICALSVVFWAVYEQQGNSMQIFADSRGDWTIGSWTMPSSWFQSLNPAFILLLIPVLNIYWKWKAAKGKAASSISKMAFGSIVVGLSFLVLIWGDTGNVADKIHFLWFVLMIFVLTIGEIYLSPIGLSLITKVSPAKTVGMMMGVWFMSSFFGGILSGILGSKMPVMDQAGNITQTAGTLSMSNFFYMLTLLGIATGIAIWSLSKPLKKGIGAADI